MIVIYGFSSESLPYKSPSLKTTIHNEFVTGDYSTIRWNGIFGVSKWYFVLDLWLAERLSSANLKYFWFITVCYILHAPYGRMISSPLLNNNDYVTSVIVVKGMLLFECGNWTISKPNIKITLLIVIIFYHFYWFLTVFFVKIDKILIESMQPYFDLWRYFEVIIKRY